MPHHEIRAGIKAGIGQALPRSVDREGIGSVRDSGFEKIGERPGFERRLVARRELSPLRLGEKRQIRKTTPRIRRHAGEQTHKVLADPRGRGGFEEVRVEDEPTV